MSCEPKRGLRGVLALIGVAALAVEYVAVAAAVATPDVDEAYRRTWMTGEFSVYPQSDAFAGVDGLTLVPGRIAHLTDRVERRSLSRFGWDRDEDGAPTLDEAIGHFYFRLPDGKPDAAVHRLQLGFDCPTASTPQTFAVSVDGRRVGSADCRAGAAAGGVSLVIGRLDARTYHDVAIALDRPSAVTADGAPALRWFGLDAGERTIAAETGRTSRDDRD
jgi:hypothetical protein